MASSFAAARLTGMQKRSSLKFVLALSVGALLNTAGATSLDFGASYRSVGADLMQRGWARFGVSEVDFMGGTFSAGVSNRAADVGFSRSLSLAPLGVANARTDLAVTWQGGVRLASRATATLGPVALNLGGAYFTTNLTNIDPLAAWAFAPQDLRENGWNADVAARYRVNRTLVAVLGGEFGAQYQGFVGVEGRRDFTRMLPLAPDADPESEPDTENLGSLSWRVGARAGQSVLGATLGATYATESGVNLALDGLLGPNTFGVTGSLGAPNLLGEGSTLRLYAAYEPWRVASTMLRAGLEGTLPVGAGELGFNVSGGKSGLGITGYGAKVTYRLPLGEQNP